MMKLRKTICILIVCLIMVCAAGCAKKTSPTDTVKKFSDAIKVFDLDTMNECVANGKVSSTIDFEKDETIGEMTEYFRKWAKEMKYQVVSAEEKGNTATVTVEYTHADASRVSEDALSDYINQLIAMALSGASDEEMTELLTKLLIEKAETSEIGTKQTTVVYTLNKIDGKWLIESIPEDAVHVLTGDLVRPLLDMADALSE